MQSLKITLLILCLLLASPAQAEQMEMGALKTYLTKLKNKEVSPLDTYIQGVEEKNITIREIAKGRPILLHFWATWCAPCIKEMPALATMAEEMKEENVLILALSEDFGGVEKVTEFYKKNHITGLEPYVDVMTGTANLMDVEAMPVTVFMDAEGSVLQRITGPIHWEDNDVINKVKSLASLENTPAENATGSNAEAVQEDSSQPAE